MDTQTQKKVVEFFTKHYESVLGQTFGTTNQDSETLTFAKVLETVHPLNTGLSTNRFALTQTQPLFAPAPRFKIITSDLLTISTTKPLSIFERFRVWIESLADKAEVYYHYPRVQRSILRPDPKAYLLDSHTLVCHPAVYFQIRQKYASA